MEAYKGYLKNEVEELRAKGKGFLDGSVSRVELRGFSGGFGSYAQSEDGKFMIRLRMPSGIITKEHFKLVLDYAKDAGLEKIHFTTRQAVQIHDLSIDQVCDMMKDAIDHDLFTRGGGGHFPRNVALSPMAGVDPNEAFDATPFAVQVGNYFFRNATTYKLPRKLKVAFSSSMSDTAGVALNDMGFMGVLDEGRPMFRMWLAGGMGNNPAAGVLYDELVKPEEVLYYVEAMIRLFMAEGDYENKAKARTRYIVKRMGEAAFLECYKKHLADVFAEHQFEGIEAVPVTSAAVCAESENDLILPQRQADRYAVVLHPICGQLKLEDGDIIWKFISEVPEADLRLSMDEALYVRNLTKVQAETLLEMMKGSMMTSNLSMSVSCVGTPTCEVGVNQSQTLCRNIIEAVKIAGLDGNRFPQMYISGCPNCCARHASAALGFAGRKITVNGETKEAFTCFVGGKVAAEASVLVDNCGTILAERIPAMMVELGQMLEKEDKSYTDALADGSVMNIFEKYFEV